MFFGAFFLLDTSASTKKAKVKAKYINKIVVFLVWLAVQCEGRFLFERYHLGKRWSIIAICLEKARITCATDD